MVCNIQKKKFIRTNENKKNKKLYLNKIISDQNQNEDENARANKKNLCKFYEKRKT